MYIIPAVLAFLLCVGHGRRLQNSFEDDHKPGMDSDLQALQALFQVVAPDTAFNPSGIGHVGPLNRRSRVASNRVSQIKMNLPWKRSRHTGVVEWYDWTKKRGWIKMENGELISVNVKGIDVSQKVRGILSLNDGEKVEFNIRDSRNGGVEASDVTGPLGKDLQGKPKGAIEPPRNAYKFEKFNKTVAEKVAGTVVKWTAKGYGYIRTDKGDRDVFVSIQDVDRYEYRIRGVQDLIVGEKVEFSMVETEAGVMKAVNVTGQRGVPLKGVEKTKRLINTERFRGVVDEWIPTKKIPCGFIVREGDGKRFYVSKSDINNGQWKKGAQHLIPGERVEFRINYEKSWEDNSRAADVTGPGLSDLKAVDLFETSGKSTGTVTHVFGESGWASIMTDGGDELFAHASAAGRIGSRWVVPKGEKVEFRKLNEGPLGYRITRVMGPGGTDLQATYGEPTDGEPIEQGLDVEVPIQVLKTGIRGVVKRWFATNQHCIATLDNGLDIEVKLKDLDISQKAKGINEFIVGEQLEFDITGAIQGYMEVAHVTGPGGADLKGVARDRQVGVVYRWEDKGFGFLKNNGNTYWFARNYFTRNQQMKGVNSVAVGQMVEFTPATKVRQSGRQDQVAVDVTGIGGLDLTREIPIGEAATTTGFLVSWNYDRNFGYIKADSGEEIFVHATAFSADGKHTGCPRSLVPGMELEFRAQQGMAFDVTAPGGGSLWDVDETPEALERSTGKVKWFNSVTGWGTILDDNGEEIDVQAANIAETIHSLEEGAKVEYGVRIDAGQRKSAIDVNVLGQVAEAGAREPVAVR